MTLRRSIVVVAGLASWSLAAPTPAIANGCIASVRIAGTEYSGSSYTGLRPAPVARGERIGEVSCYVCAARLCMPTENVGPYPAGTPIYTVPGYAPTFRIAVATEGGLEIYEASRSPGARRGSELLDIVGKLDRVEVRRQSSAGEQHGFIVDRRRLGELSERLARAPTTAAEAGTPVDFYDIRFQFRDRTGTVRRLDIARRVLEPGIVVSDDLLDIFRTALSRRSGSCREEAGRLSRRSGRVEWSPG